METNADRRRRKLIGLCNKHGLKVVADAAGLNPDGLDQIIKGVLLPPKKDGSRSPRKLGDDAAGKIEDAPALGLWRGWFDSIDTEEAANASSTQDAEIIRGTRTTERPAIDLSNNPDYPAVRRVKFKLSAGATGFGVDYLGDEDAPIVFKRAWFTSNGYRPESLFAVRVANGSMEPGLHDGDTVVVNTAQTEPKDGKVFAINYEGELVIKRLVRDAGQWWLASDNPDQTRYPRKQAHAGALLLGEIVHKQSERI